MMIRRACFAFLAFLTLTGFVVEGPRGGGVDAKDHLDRAPRWSATQNSLSRSGERGLGGGLEYAIDDSLCGLSFIDGADCGDISDAIAEALEIWSSGHPSLSFTDITGEVTPGFRLAALGQTGQGAEIDFFGQTGREFPPFLNRQTTGYTIFYERPEAGPVRLTNGEIAPHAAAIESADVRVNASRCYYIDTEQGRPDCLHFPSIILHEIGHALGIGHPEDNPRYNLDSDTRPQTPVKIDCTAPSKGLFMSPFYDGAAVLVGRDVQGPGRWRRGLTADDVAARDALYPDCGIAALPRFAGQWGAFAIDAHDLEGRARFERDEETAMAKALSQCDAAGGKDCRLIASFNACFAYATGARGAAAHASSPRSDYARANAVLACAKSGEDCRVRADFCAFE